LVFLNLSISGHVGWADGGKRRPMAADEHDGAVGVLTRLGIAYELTDDVFERGSLRLEAGFI
jgi:hypothetical protein